MGIGSGLGATLGLALETTVGTFKPVTRWLPFESEGIALKKKIAQAEPLMGSLYLPSRGRAYTTHTVDGPIKLYGITKQLGLLFKAMLGSTPTATEIGTTGAYTQVHKPGDTEGVSLSVQVGRPETTGTIAAFSYNGVKITDWDLTVDVDKLLEFNLTVDGWSEVTTVAYAAASYVTVDYLQFAEATLYVGGTVSTTAGVLKVTSPTTMATAKNCSIKGTNKLDVERFYLGSAGVKAEQLADGFRGITGTADIEFRNLTDLYTAFHTDTSTALELTFTGPKIGTSGTNHAQLNVLIPSVYWTEGPPSVDGPKILVEKGKFTGLETHTFPALQLTYVSTDSVI